MLSYKRQRSAVSVVCKDLYEHQVDDFSQDPISRQSRSSYPGGAHVTSLRESMDAGNCVLNSRYLLGQLSSEGMCKIFQRATMVPKKLRISDLTKVWLL